MRRRHEAPLLRVYCDDCGKRIRSAADCWQGHDAGGVPALHCSRCNHAEVERAGNQAADEAKAKMEEASA